VSLLLVIAPSLQCPVFVYEQFLSIQSTAWVEHLLCDSHEQMIEKMNRAPALIQWAIQRGATESEQLIDCVTLRGNRFKQEMELESDVKWCPLVLY